jgi:hypothetical protein
MRNACPCCGYRTLVGASPSPSWETCPVCWWTDDDTTSAARTDELIRAQAAFAQDGASEPCWRGMVRAPTPDEPRDPGWRPHQGMSPRALLRADLALALRKAFGEVSPGERLGLRETYRRDFQAEPDIDWNDGDARWPEVPGAVLDYFGNSSSAFTFGTLDDFRYYLPAFMHRSLDRDRPLAALMALAAPGHPERVAALDEGQRAVVVAFLGYVTTYFPESAWADATLRRWRSSPDVR